MKEVQLQPSKCTTQVMLNTLVTHLAATQHVPLELELFGVNQKISPSGKNPF